MVLAMLIRKIMILTVLFVSMSQALCFAENKKEISKIFTNLEKAIDENKLASDDLKSYAKKVLVPMCTKAFYVKEIKAQNAKKMTLADIKKIDEEWIAAKSEIPLQKEKLNNACAEELKKFSKNNPAIAETFLMDNQGGVVGENNLTSDYWQGDEEKFTNSYNEGKGGVDVGKNKFDKSSNMMIQQISLPMIDETGKVIGAITYGYVSAKK